MLLADCIRKGFHHERILRVYSERQVRSAVIRHGEIEGHDLIVSVESEEPYLADSYGTGWYLEGDVHLDPDAIIPWHERPEQWPTVEDSTPRPDRWT